jgi:hypothetical protein
LTVARPAVGDDVSSGPGPDPGVAGRPPAGSGHPTWAELAGLAVVVAGVSAFVAWWWWAYRDGMPLFIDEAGYLSFAEAHARALQDHGLAAFARSIHDQGPYGPLVPVVSALGLLVADTPVTVGAVTMVGSVALFVVATWFLARRLCAPPWALLAAAVAGTLPGVLLLAGVYYFAVPAAALYTLGVACLVRSGGGARLGWMVAAGASFGLASLARTMVAGLVPAAGAVVLAAALWPGPARARRLAGVLLGGAVGAAVALTWYAGNTGRVIDYLGSDQVATGGGGGGRAWAFPGVRDLRLLLSDLLLPAAVVLVAAVAVAAVAWLRARRGEPESRPAPAPGPGMAVPAAVVALGGGILVVAGQAVGQWIPLVPTLVAVVVAGLARAPGGRTRNVVAAGLCALVLFHIVEVSRLVPALSTPRDVAAGPLGRLHVTDARWLLEDQVPTARLDAGGRLPDSYAGTGAVIDAVVARAAEQAVAAGEPPVLVMPGGADPLVNINTLHLADQRRDAVPALVVGALALDPGLTAPQLAGVLGDPDRGQPNLVLAVRPERRYERPLAVYEDVTAALPAAGFAPVLDRELPDGRAVTLWWRPRSMLG